MRPLLVVLALLAVALLIGSRFYPTIETVAVSGNSHYDREEVRELAGVEPGGALLWVNRWSLAELANDPWIRRARVIRHWPDTVSINVWERTPVITDGTSSWAADGTLLPGVSEETKAGLVRLEGWGEPRLEEALKLLELLSQFGPRVISYSPEGFDIELREKSLYTPGVAVLERHWAAWTNQRGSRVAVYPWGVSERDD
ncbi:MAG TPA: FtsQ-type POTRA domain-containing protein [Trueperaceae bacterium]